MTTKTTADTKLIEASLELFISRGFQSTAVDDICKAAGVSKGSFYHFYKSKEDLGLAALKDYYRQGRKLVMTGEFHLVRDPFERVDAFLDHVEGLAVDLWKNGCLLGTLAVDIGNSHPRIREEISRMFDELEGDMAQIFAPYGASNGHLDKPSAREIARHYLSVIEGSVIMARAHGSPESIPAGLRPFRYYLASLRG